ncbi:MAG: hypothetical protein KGL35_05295 [Bradyrhizobium sp.]|nr:hypothetical protein [Bradyrhizobium sp.]
MNWPGQASKHEADHGETDEGRHDSRIAFEIAGTTTRCRSLRLTISNVQVRPWRWPRRPWLLAAGINEDGLDEGKEAADASIEDKRRAIAILYIGGMDDDIQQEAVFACA